MSAARPRLIYLCTRFPWPLDRGDRMRAWNLVQQFSKHADVTLVSFTEGHPTAAPVQKLLPFCERVEVIPLPRRVSQLNMVANLVGKEPFQVAYYRSEIMDRLIDRLALGTYDIAFAQLFRMRPYLDRFIESRRFIELSDSLTLNLKRAIPIKPFYVRPAFREELRRVDRYERETLTRVEEAWVVSKPDRIDLVSRVPGARVEVIPIGVERRWGSAGLDGPKTPAALFLGNLTVGHNVDAARYLAETIWPEVRRTRPDAVLHLVGTANQTVRALRFRPGVLVHGFVDDLTPFLKSSVMSLAPLRYGAGIQNKVLETMAAGLPAVVTRIVSDPIGVEPGREIVTADTAEALVDAIVRLLGDPAAARAIGAAGQARVGSSYTWDRAGERMRELLG